MFTMNLHLLHSQLHSIGCAKYSNPVKNFANNFNKLCSWRHNVPPPFSFPVDAQAPHAAELSRRNVAAVYHAEHVLTRTATAILRFKASLSKAAS